MAEKKKTGGGKKMAPKGAVRVTAPPARKAADMMPKEAPLPVALARLPRPGAPPYQNYPAPGTLPKPSAPAPAGIVHDSPSPLLPGFKQAHVAARTSGVPLQGPPVPLPGMGNMGMQPHYG